MGQTSDTVLQNAAGHDIIKAKVNAETVEVVDSFQPKNYSATIQSYINTDRSALISAAKDGKRHAGVYRDATTKSKEQLQKSIVSHVNQVKRHADKIKSPETYVPDWDKRSQQYKSGLLRKWEKDMKRNAEQAEIELAVFEERFNDE